jgi:type II secretory pathway pseudopilin PulG
MQAKKRINKRGAFTIVELLTVMSVIIILISLLVPALNQVKRYAKEVKQRAQFHSIDVAMELFETENQGYPNSDEDGSDGNPYCGAMKLAEAMVGQDLSGFHRDSTFRSDLRISAGGVYLYAIPNNAQSETDAATKANQQSRRGPYLGIENANATRIKDIYDANSLNNFTSSMGERFVLCDVYTRTMTVTGLKKGMPILYYKANLSGTRHPSTINNYPANNADNIYDYKDNDDLVQEGVPWDPTVGKHPMDGSQSEGSNNDGVGVLETFYWRMWNEEIPLRDGRPYKADSYILLSAGFDGLYGTRDDIYNFNK